MIDRVTMADCSAHIAAYLDGRLTHKEVVEWARAAMLAQEMPAHEQRQIMDLLLDISASTEQSFARAAKEYRKMTSPLITSARGSLRRN
jgi:hypothetical protein